ncbi:hypothetical protein H8356DRAFT_928924 [Neocallimastix lanati (nom. inval.)]|uniref:glutathione transferase n=1 Tax=Neocallimastix californiae TaxID=1754190 RepID=A0A1Y2CQF1_9FUNG|nr:hypothetical protein H8356DRAFT_928924 [Neocallimastix sp. JGI-2020a]ORY49261.1 hypothetical protein LY90DRAFT_619389 [Neocallimastix californiae]|eukprot:ORY49261.1 hypothetical protein LY90DRAFT_619389 [Neocallimastix californiae]
MNSRFEVYYFSIQGRAEYIRLLLTVARATWINKVPSNWPQEKISTEDLLYEQLPMLIEHKSSGEEFRLVQMGPIIRYIADTFELKTDCKYKNSLLDSYFEGLYDIIDKFIHVTLNTKSKDLSDAFKDFLNDEFINQNISYQEDILAKNGSNGHYMDNKLTYVDVIAFGLIDASLQSPGLKGLFSSEKTPNLMKVYDNVAKIPEIRTYLNSKQRYVN